MMKTGISIKVESDTGDWQRCEEEAARHLEKTGAVSCSSSIPRSSDSIAKGILNKALLAEINSRQVRVILKRCDAQSGLKGGQKRKAASTVSFFQSSVGCLRSNKSSFLSVDSAIPPRKKECRENRQGNSEKSPTEKMKSALSTSTNSMTRSAPSKPACSVLHLTPDSIKEIHLADSINGRQSETLQVLFVKLDEDSSNMTVFIGWKPTYTRNQSDQLMFQCLFCPTIDTSAKDISRHVKTQHGNALFAVGKKLPSASSLLYMMCRHCDFVGVDIIGMWIHFAIYHSLRGIISIPLRDKLDPPPDATMTIDPLQVATVFPFYQCNSCSFLALDFRLVAQHVLQCSPEGSRNGLFARVGRIIRPNKLLKKTYKELAEDEEFSDMRSEMFVCLTCQYVCYCEVLLLEHHIRLHAGKALVYLCIANSCSYRASSTGNMLQHIKECHSSTGSSVSKMCCSITIVEQRNDSICQCL